MATPPPAHSRTPPPPMSMTSLPSTSRPIETKPLCVKPPVLASDILREEIAPIAPAKRAIRASLAAFAATFAVAALMAKVGIGPLQLTSRAAFEGSLVIAALAAVAATVPLPYAARAAVAAVAGLLPLIFGVLQLGPVAAFGAAGPLRAALAIPILTLLPAALVFRARYRAFRAARVILAVALVACLPGVALLALGAFDVAAPVGDRLTAGLACGAVLTALFGFMGPETSAACVQWAATVVLAYAARGALDAIEAAWSGDAIAMSAYAAAAAGELIASMLVTFALFQILAVALASRARQVDVHQIAATQRSVPPSADG